MEKTLGKDYAVTQREAFLKDNCDQVEEKGYMKRLTPEQIQENKEKLAETAIAMNEIAIEKKKIALEFKTQLEPLTAIKGEILTLLKQKAEYKKEICYKFVDQEEKMVGYYNAEGDLIEARPANAEELQGTIFQIGRKTGTNG